MALVKCPDCGKMVSERVKSCPFCGCPAEFFDYEHENFNEQAQNSNVINFSNISETEAKEISFKINNHVFRYNDDEKEFALRAGIYFSCAHELCEELKTRYDEKRNIVSVIKEFPKQVSDVLNKMINDCTQYLFGKGIIITSEQLWEKYSNKYCMDLGAFCSDVLDKYSEILAVQADLENIRNQIKAGRGRWEGGGFGVAGAIKGAVTASALNAGSDFFHFFGDMARESKDNKEIQQRLLNLYNDTASKKAFCDGAYRCILNVLYAERDELLENGYKVINLDKEKADTLFEVTCNYAKGEEEKNEKVMQCIEKFPGNYIYYGEIIDTLSGNENEFYNFLKFWNIERMMSNYVQQLEKKRQQMYFVEQMTKMGALTNYSTDGIIKTIEGVEKFFFENEIEFDNDVYSEIVDNFFLSQKFDHNVWKDIKLVIYAAKNKEIVDYLKSIRTEHFILGSKVFKDIWLIGDRDYISKFGGGKVARGIAYPSVPDEKILNITETRIDEKEPRLLMYYKNASNNKGFCITEHYIMDISTLEEISIRAVSKICVKYLDNDLGIVEVYGEGRTIRIENDNWNGVNSGIEYLTNVLRVLFVKYFANRKLWSVDMEIAQPEVEDELISEEMRNRLDYKKRQAIYGINDWRSILLDHDAATMFSERFKFACEELNILKYWINETAGMISDIGLAKKFKLFGSIYPQVKILWAHEDVIVTGYLLNWYRVYETKYIDDIWIEVTVEQGIQTKIIDGKNKETYSCEGILDNKSLVAALRYAVGLEDTINEALNDAYRVNYTNAERYIAMNYRLSEMDQAIEYLCKNNYADNKNVKKYANKIIQKATEMRAALSHMGEKVVIRYNILLEDRIYYDGYGGLLRLDSEEVAFIADDESKSFYFKIVDIKKIDRLEFENSHCFRVAVKNKFLLYTFKTSDDAMWEEKIKEIIGSRQVPPENKRNGNSTEKMFCSYCGKKILRTVKFCNFCGMNNKYAKEKGEE